MKHLPKKLREVCENLDWRVIKCEDGTVELETFSPAGEDVVVSVPMKNFPEEIQAYYNDFDPEEHAEMWIEAKRNGVGGVPSIRCLIEDADAIDSMLEDLAIAVTQAARA